MGGAGDGGAGAAPAARAGALVPLGDVPHPILHRPGHPAGPAELRGGRILVGAPRRRCRAACWSCCGPRPAGASRRGCGATRRRWRWRPLSCG
ncbi:hypothetical protein [Teichococcus aestuarii]|uniref:hypothetical protein n=1 Tax=Teichococcus aestuarii TaxID=568898 RepID=UPI0036223CDC